MDSASEYDEKAPSRQIPGLEIKGIPKPSQAAIEQWRKERTTKLSIVGCLLFITMVTLIIIAIMQQQPILHQYVRYEMEDCICGSEGYGACYYYKRIEPSSKDWLIYLESSTEDGMDVDGGGLCVKTEPHSWLDNCKELSKVRPEDVESFDGILSTDVKNELFSSWNTVVVPWCSGFAFTANFTRADGFTVTGGALVDRVLESMDFSETDKLVLAGSGTGGLQALLRANTLNDTINSGSSTQLTDVFVIADSAFFVYPNDDKWDLWEDLYQPGSDNFLSSDCIGLHPGEESRCFWPEVALGIEPEIERPEIPMFIIQSWYDIWNMRNLIDVKNCFDSHTFAYLESTCADISKAHNLKVRMENSLGKLFYNDSSKRVGEGSAQPLNPNLGFWLTSCPSHGFLAHDDSYGKWTVLQSSVQNTIKEWMEGNVDDSSRLNNDRNYTKNFVGCQQRGTPTF